MDYWHQLFGIFLHGRFVTSLPGVYLFNRLFLSVWRHGYLFYIFGCSPILLYYVVEIVLINCVSQSHSHHCKVFVFGHLLAGTTKCPSLIFWVSCPSPRISCFSKEPWFPRLESSVSNQNRGSACACCVWGPVLLGAPSWPNADLRVCSYVYIFTPVNISIRERETLLFLYSPYLTSGHQMWGGFPYHLATSTVPNTPR